MIAHDVISPFGPYFNQPQGKNSSLSTESKHTVTTSMTMTLQTLTVTITVLAAASQTMGAHGFQPELPKGFRNNNERHNNRGIRVLPNQFRHDTNRNVNQIISSKLQMVRNVDLPEALVFYGLESILEPLTIDTDFPSTNNDSNGNTDAWKLRSGVARLLNECQEVGTTALLLSEYPSPCLNDVNEGDNFEDRLQSTFERGWVQSFSEMKLASPKSPSLSSFNAGNAKTLIDDVISFRCPQSTFNEPIVEYPDENDDSDTIDNYRFYNLKTNGKSPSPAFLLDSLHSIHIDPRGFGGSSGFGRGQWVEPRRSPMPARTVVFVAGDWGWSSDNQPKSEEEEEEEASTVKDRCAAARAAGCRLIYLEQSSEEQSQQGGKLSIRDDTNAMSLCDAVITTFGNDNPRDLNPITLDAISTPGDYWLNPPLSRDDGGNNVSADDVVEWFRLQREMDKALGDEGCVVGDHDLVDETLEVLSEDDINSILADLDAI